MVQFKLPLKNDPAKAGQLAAKKQFVNGYRFAVAPVHTRFDTVTWFVWDAEHPNSDMTAAEIIRQEDTLEAALASLPTAEEA